MDVRTPQGARWSCHQCADCCRSFDIGPIEPEVVDRLRAAEIGRHHPPARDGWLSPRSGPDGQPRPFFRIVDGHCVFLQEDDRCALHVLLGPEAKPGMCRAYPFRITRDARGLAMTALPSCGGYHASSVDGQPLEEQSAELLALGQPAIAFDPPSVSLVPGLQLPMARWMEVEPELLALLRSSTGDPPQLLATARRWLADLADVDVPEDDERRAHLALGAAYEGLIRLMEPVTSGRAVGVDAARQRFAQEIAAELPRAQRSLTSPAPLSPAAREWLNLLLRSAILSKQVHAQGSIAAGLGAFVLSTRFARVIAGSPDEVLNAARLSAALTRWERFIANRAVAQLLQRAAPALVDVFLYLPGEES